MPKNATKRNKKNDGSTATVAEVAATHNRETNLDSETPATPVKAIAVATPKTIETTSVILANLTNGWDKADARLVTSTVEFAIEQVTGAQEKLMAVGARFNTLKEKLTPEHFRSTIRAVAAMKIEGLSENNLQLWMARAKVLRNTFRVSPLIAQKIMLLSDSRGIVKRYEPSKEEKEQGIGGHYDLSEPFKAALEAAGTIPVTTKESEAEAYARNLLSKVKREPRVASKAKDLKRIKAQFTSYMDNWKQSASANLLYELFQMFSQEFDDIDVAVELVGRMDQLVNENATKTETKSKAAKVA